MTTRDAEFASQITRYLDAGTASMKQGTAYRLQSARQQALAQLAGREHVTAPELALAGTGYRTAGSGGGRGFWTSARLWVGIALIAAGSIGYQQWQSYQHSQQVRDNEETDAAILTSDLPIDAYLDRGFQNWLKHDDDH
jgi:hypothetical protein